MTSVALVLGAGGRVGAAYHAGSLAALHELGGWDARTADLIVGTSAGSTLAATLRAGLAPGDHLARADGRALTADGAALLDPLGEGIDLDLARRGLWLPLPASPRLAAASVLRRGRPRPGLALAGLLPRGSIDADAIGDAIRAVHPDRWPAAPTWICAVDLDAGHRTVFGRDDVDADLGEAVQASSAIPGLFRPVKVAGTHYIDGGVHSPTNADLVAGLGFDVAIVISPMTAVRAAFGRTVGATGRAYHAGLLRDEVKTVRERGTVVLTLQPTIDDLAVTPVNAMDERSRAAVATQAFESARRKLERPDVAALLAQAVEVQPA